MSVRHTALGLAMLAFALSAPAAVPERQVARTLPLSANGAVSMEAYKGSIHVHTWDKAEVDVKARVVADDSCGNERDQAEKVAKTEVEIVPSGHGVSIRVDYDKVPERHHLWFGCSSLPFVHLEVTLPKSADVSVKDYKSRIHLAPLDGDITLETYKGTADLAGVGGALHLTTYKGEVRASLTLRKDCRVETYKGEVALTLPKGAPFTLGGEIGRRGELDSDFPVAASASHRSEQSLHGSVNGGGPVLKVTTTKGTIRLRAK